MSDEKDRRIAELEHELNGFRNYTEGLMQVNQRMEERIERLTAQVTLKQLRIEELEAEVAKWQDGCDTQGKIIEKLGEKVAYYKARSGVRSSPPKT